MVALQAALLSLVPLAFGILLYRYAYTLTRIGEQVDAIGSTTELSTVEPATWNVYLGKGIGVMFMILGAVMLLGALLA